MISRVMKSKIKMKKTILSTLIAIGLIGSASAQVQDDFSNTDYSNNWNTLLPFNHQIIYDWTSHDVVSSASQSGGYVTLTGGATLDSKLSFTSPYIFSGVFDQTSNPGGRTMIHLRGDGSSTDSSFGQPLGGIQLFFFGDPGNSANWKCDISQDGTFVTETYRDNSFTLSHDAQTSFSIIDYGTSMDVTINGVLVSQSILSTNDMSVGGHVSISSQWSDVGGTGLQVSALSIQAVPEPSTYALFGIGAIVILTILRRKKTA